MFRLAIVAAALVGTFTVARPAFAENLLPHAPRVWAAEPAADQSAPLAPAVWSSPDAARRGNAVGGNAVVLIGFGCG